MYVPAHFAEHDPERITRFVDDHPLATLVVTVAGRLEAHHLPVLRLDRLEAGGRLLAHVARGNPLWRQAEGRVDALLVLVGAGGYVSPSFYASKAEHHRVVPTYNYAAVHVHGELSFSHDESDKRRAVEMLTRRMEASRAQPWAVGDAPAGYVAKMLDGIVALSLEIRSIEAKFKASQNKSVADRQGVMLGLREAAGAVPESEAADLIEAGLAERPGR
jgi:transcriptional regulator